MTTTPRCLIVGGGPAGVTAAIYLARFHLDVTVIDDGNSRMHWIARTHNHAGFPGGVNGTALLARMVEQAEQYQVKFIEARVTALDRDGSNIYAEWGDGRRPFAAVLLATGVENKRPDISDVMHETALERALLRYCPVCDGFEITDKRIAVIGTATRGVDEACFLRSFTGDITLISPGPRHDMSPDDLQRCRQFGIQICDGPATIQRLDTNEITISTSRGPLTFFSAYPALGSISNSDLARRLGAKLGDAGCIETDSHQQTSIPGIYAAGDVVLGLDQISHAMGEGAVAATTMRNIIAKDQPLMR